MSQEKYIGMDVHQATISAAVRNAQGKLLMECVLETRTLVLTLISPTITGLRDSPQVFGPRCGCIPNFRLS